MAEPAKRVWPIDLLLVYITPSSHAVGPRLTLQTIDRRLSGLSLRPVLRLLAIVAHQADRAIADRDERLALAKALLRPGPARERALALITSGPHAIVSSQTALVLALRALVSCPDEPRVVDDEELGYRLGELLVAIGDHLGTRTSGDHLLLELVRVGLFYRLFGLGDWYSTAHGVFFETLPSMTHDHEYIDVDGLLQSELGLSLQDYWGLSAIVGIIALGDKHLHTYPKQIGGLPTDVLVRWFDVHTQTVADARVRAETDLATGSSWALGTFFSRPIVSDITDGAGYPMRSQFLALKGTLIGMHYLVSDLLRRNGDERSLAWSRFFGRAVERYGRDLLEKLLEQPETLSFPEAERPLGPEASPACDFYIDEGSAVVAGDFVHRALTLATQTTGSLASLERDLRVAVVEKVDQIEASLLIKNPTAQRLYPLIVMSGPLPMNPSLAAKLDELLASTSRTFIGTDPRCSPVLVLELHELRMLLLTAATNGVRVTDVIESWQSSPLRSNSFRDWLTTQSGLRKGVAQPGESWEAKVAAIFGKSAELDDVLETEHSDETPEEERLSSGEDVTG
jgi:hypothetical protein